jgi:IS30 family transposase
LHHAGESAGEIARELGRHRSAISRELKRNSDAEGYRAGVAEAKARQRRRERPWTKKMDRPEINQMVREGLSQYWSPDQITGRARQQHASTSNLQVSHQTIYAWIRQDQHRTHWEQFLRRGGKRRPAHDRRGKIPGTVSIDGRPKVVDERKRYGDWEGDTVVGKGHRNGLLTTVERKSGYLRMAKVGNLRSESINRAARRKLGDLPGKLRRTMTFDNGKEFAGHREMAEDLDMKIYFARAYSAWQRGTNEHTNGLIRQFFPKGIDFAEVSHQTVTRIEALLNQRPRKRLGYKTPSEILAAKFPGAFET